MPHTLAVILAAGQGTRMRSDKAKVMHQVGGRSMLRHVLQSVMDLGLERRVVVIGHRAEQVRAEVDGQAETVLQTEQLGTGHAVLQAKPLWRNEEHVLVLNGDTPLVPSSLLQRLLEEQVNSGAAATVLTTRLQDPKGYGRILRDDSGHLLGIVEEVDASPSERQIDEVNTGLICFRAEPLWEALARLRPENAKGEYYLVDVIRSFVHSGLMVRTLTADDPMEVMGINDRAALAQAEALVRERILNRHLEAGVTVRDPNTTYIDASVVIEPDVTIEPGSIIRGNSIIRSGACIGPDAEVVDCEVGPGTTVWRSVVESSVIGANVRIGPFSHLRPGCRIGDRCEIGNYAELKKTDMDEGCKVHHHAYIGDARLGKRVNIGAGVVTVNYDGTAKHETVMEDDAFIGCNVNLIAPLHIGARAYIAAGSTLTGNVEEDALAIARSRQENKAGWVKRRRSAQH